MILHCLVEGNSIRSTSRLCDVEKRTVLTILKLAGERCERFLETNISGIPVRELELDECWSYVLKKEGHKRPVESDGGAEAVSRPAVGRGQLRLLTPRSAALDEHVRRSLTRIRADRVLMGPYHGSAAAYRNGRAEEVTCRFKSYRPGWKTRQPGSRFADIQGSLSNGLRNLSESDD